MVFNLKSSVPCCKGGQLIKPEITEIPAQKNEQDWLVIQQNWRGG